MVGFFNHYFVMQIINSVQTFSIVLQTPFPFNLKSNVLLVALKILSNYLYAFINIVFLYI